MACSPLDGSNGARIVTHDSSNCNARDACLAHAIRLIWMTWNAGCEMHPAQT